MQRTMVTLSALLVFLATVCCSLGPFGSPDPSAPVEEVPSPLPALSATPTVEIVTDPPEVLAAELPPDLWASITPAFDYQPSLTERFTNMGADLIAQMPPLHNVQAWVFSHPGDVHAAYTALEIPAEAEAIPPYKLTLDTALDLYLESWATQLEAARGAAWIADAHTILPDWATQTQTLAEFNFTVVAYPGAIEAELEGEDPFVTWAFSVLSPMVDLDAIEIIPGTYLVILRFQFAY